MGSVVVVVVFLVGFLALMIFWQVRRRLRRARAVRAWAEERGLNFDLQDPHDLYGDSRSVFSGERRRRVGNTTWGKWGTHEVLAGDLTTSTRDNETHRVLSVVRVPLPFTAPAHVSVVPHDLWSRVKDKLGFEGISLPSEDFNKRYDVRSDDREFAVELLDLSLIAWLLTIDRRFGLDVLGGRVVFTSEILRPEELGKLFDAATGFVDRIPPRVLEAYPG
ncbi:MAG TPA: hypothetical protein VHI71_04790 [Actinomycetota bacterium]|nr:hypothetical protein [Actinomycetota bacterium]